MTSFSRKIATLVWKCQLLRRRNWIISLLELIIPLSIFLLLSIVYFQISKFTRGKEIPWASGGYSAFFFSLNYLDVAYAPKNKFSTTVMEQVIDHVRLYKPYARIATEAEESEEYLVHWLKTKTYSSQNATKNPEMGIVFSEIDTLNDRYKYKIRTTDPNMITNELDNSNTYTAYTMTSLFLGIQIVLDKVLLRTLGVEDNRPWLFGNLPSKPTILSEMTTLLYFFLVFAYMFLVISVIRDVVDEKECGTKELMKVMGVNSWMIWIHWLIYTMMVQFPVTVVATYIFTVWKPVVISAGVFIVLLLFLLFTVSFTVMLFVVSCLFYKTTGALTSCLIGWFILNMLIESMVIAQLGNISLLLELLAGLFPLVNLCLALSSLWSFHAHGMQWEWSNLFTKGYIRSGISVGDSIIIFILSMILYTFILIYLDAVYPGPYGVPKPLTFLCQWLRERLNPKEQPGDIELVNEQTENFEPVTKSTKVGIMLRGLKKDFGFFRKKVAVENVDLDIYQGEIMALLGHNGAGKTTTMSMITGMIAPSKGVIMFEGKNITKNKTKFRENLGLCPQHNLYFSKLTVIEHLMFFGMLKGMTRSESKASGKSLLYKLNMLDKADTRGSMLSGGMKRRLCLAVSLTGNPKVLILDEPTSGLDPQTRRVLWDIILGMRGQRTVLITTHFMEEADVLGDRIAIMDHGRVVCCGTSMFLKKLFGAGYHIHVLKQPNSSVKAISNLVQQNISNFEINVISNNQVDFIIKEEFLDQFPALFSALEKQKSSSEITGITVTCSSMEDVFLKVADMPFGNTTQVEHGKPLSAALHIEEFERLGGTGLLCQRICALFEKRYIYRMRHALSLLFKLACILLMMVYLALHSQISRVKYKEQKEISLNLNLYPDATVLMAYDKEFSSIGNVAEKVANLLLGTVKVFSNISEFEEYLENESAESSYNYVRKILFALTFINDKITVRYHTFTNPHAPAIAVQFLTNILLQDKKNGTGLIEAINHPFVNTDSAGICDQSENNPILLEMFVVYPILLFFSISSILLLGDFIRFITEERVSGFKHQQFLAGASPLIYWFVNLIFDFCVYFISIVMVLMVFSILGPKITLMRLTWFGLFVLVLFLQGWCGVSLTYLHTFCFDGPGASLAIYNTLMICLGMFPALVISTGVLEFFQFVTFPWFLFIVSLLSFNPVFATTMCIRYIIRVIVLEEFCRVCTNEECPKEVHEVLRMPTEDNYSGINLYLIFLVITSLLYPLIIQLIDIGLVRKTVLLLTNNDPDFYNLPSNTDDDVKLEIARVEAFKFEEKDTPLRVESLEKKYLCGPKAVDKVSFLVLTGDCFGLLGVNGAGKSTAFKMLTAEILPDKGDAYIYSFSVKTDRTDYMSSVGYCPQFDAVLLTLTGEEILSIIAKIRGVPSFEVENAVTVWLDVMGISEYGDKQCGTYSGGTKRKLSTAMALIGSPEVVLMDEPTTGVDPASRRKLWTVIKEMQKQGQAVVLTSHSMEECEALCSRLTIMVAGRMKCIGSVEYLKTKFGRGFTVLLKLNEHRPEEVELLKQDFNRLFVNSSIKDEHDILIHYTVLDPKISLSRLFSDLVQFKSEHSIVADFTASNTTLEELFLSFATNTQRRLS